MKRGYGSEPVLLTASPVTAPANAAGKKWRHYLPLTIGILVIASVSVVWWAFNHKKPSFIPRSVAAAEDFPLYQPLFLPSGFAVDRSSIDVTSQVVTFNADGPNGRRLIFTEQLKPAQTDLDTFYAQQLTGVSSFAVPDGHATIGQFEGSFLGGVTTDKTWVLIHSVGDVNQADFKHVTEKLTLTKR